MIEWWAVAGVLLWYILTAFQKNRPVARTLGMLVYISASYQWLAFTLFGEGDPAVAVLQVLEVLGIALTTAWFVFGAAFLIFIMYGTALAWWETRERAGRSAEGNG